ncbi:MAG: N-acetylmuramoyl-L-alanine amidase [Peptococcaceae bacterium]|jgi:N-acetylmuramoyl-L-alanine amidase|nr:N-acetylmuramoyl-L-alanine amidase [Peptococcaceae bacterium]
MINTSKIVAIALIMVLVAATGVQPLIARVVVVQKENVNIRQDADARAEVVSKADKGMFFRWQGASDGWTQISYAEGVPGFIRNDMLQAYDEVVVTGASVRIRKSPMLNSEVLGGVKKGDALTVLDYQKGWYKVLYGQAEGWISADYAKLGSPVDLASTPATGQTPGTGENTSDPDDVEGASQGVPKPGETYNFDSAIVSKEVQPGVLSGKIITLDPGHGMISDGKPMDPGAQSAVLGIWEKDVNLDIALKLKKILENLGATVWMTHAGTTRLNLYGRAALANQNGSHIFISIHANSSENLALNGHSVYFYAPAADKKLGLQRSERKALAGYVQESMTKTCGLADLGVRENNFVVLRETDCPSILIETAFLSYTQEELLLSQGAFRQRLADAIAFGALKYFGAV